MPVETSDLVLNLLKGIAVLAIVLLLAYLVLGQGLKKIMIKTREGKRIKVIETVMLTRGSYLHIVTIDNQEIIVSSADNHPPRINEINLPKEPPLR